MPLESRALPRVSPDVIWTAVGDGAVLFSVERELYYGVNEVAAIVWEHLNRGATFEDVYVAARERFPDVSREILRTDIDELLCDLERHGLIIAEATG